MLLRRKASGKSQEAASLRRRVALPRCKKKKTNLLELQGPKGRGTRHFGGQHFPVLALLTIWAREFFVVGDSAVCHRMLSNCSGLYLLGASSTTSKVVTTIYVSGHCQMFPQGQNHTYLRSVL